MATIPTAAEISKAAQSALSSVGAALPALPSPGDVVKRISGLVGGVPIEDVFDKSDLGGFLVVFGDRNGDRVLDVRLVPVRVSAGRGVAMPAAQAGPENIPIHDAIAGAAEMAAALPAPANIVVGGVLGTVAGATGLLQRLALPK